MPKKITQKVYVWLILAIIFGIFFGLLFASYLVGDTKTTGRATAIYNTSSNQITGYYCKCDYCLDSIFGTFVENQSCVYSGEIKTQDQIINSCKECCQEYNCNNAGYNLNAGNNLS